MRAGHLGAVLGLIAGAAAQAQDRYGDDVVVRADRVSPTDLDAPAPIASALGLTALDTPASVEAVDLSLQTRRGFRSLAEATRGVTGVTFTTRAGAPGVFSTRGFTENALVTLYDGVRVQSATITARPYDPFNFERIEVLRGPNSLVYGEGATAGAINYVRRKPRLGALRAETLIEGGEQGRFRAAAALSGGIDDAIGFNLSGSYQRLGSFVQGAASDTLHVIGSVGGRVGERTSVLIEGDHLRARTDDAYFGTPLVGGGIDAALFRRNYNRSPNNRMADDVTWLRAVVTHEFADVLDYRGQVYAYSADRDWRNFYAFSFLSGPPAQVEARNVESLGYDHRLLGTRHDLKLTTKIGAVESRTVFSLEHQSTDFSSPRRDGPPSTGIPRPRFDPFAPAPAPFVQGPRLRQRDADIRQTGLSIEQRFALGRFALVGGARLTFIDGEIARPEASPPVAPFDVSFEPVDWRVAITFQPTTRSTLYAAATSGNEPVESLLLLPLGQADFRLTRSRGYEVGYKAEYGDLSITAAGYILRRDRLPSANPADPNLPPQIGRQESSGVELAARYERPRLSAGANIAYVDATFREFNDFGAFRNDVRPANVPDLVVNADVAVAPVGGVTLGAFAQHVARRASNNANLLFLPSYTTVDLFAEVRLGDGLTLTGRVANVTDARYVEWATQSFGQNNLYFGSPRRFEASLAARF